jgi:signal transduction histidine kinase
MPGKQSITATIAGPYHAFASSSPETKYRWVEYLLILTSAVNQLGWKRVGDETGVISIAVPIVLLLVLALVNSLPVARGNTGRVVQILSELALVSLASFLGTHRVYRYLFVIVIGKAALLLNRISLLIVVLLALIQQVAFVEEIRDTHLRHVVMFPAVAGRQTIVLSEYVVYYTLALLLVLFISMLLRSEQESRRKAEQLQIERDSMAITLERERIARDIHDSLGHALKGLNIQLQLAQKLQAIQPEKSQEALSLARGFAARAVADVRRAVRAVRDSYFDFPAAVKELVETIESSGNCTVTAEIEPLSLSSQLSHNLFFLIQEGLTNIQRHAGATDVHVTLSGNDQICLQIKDNGIGFCREDTVPGFGITGMEERVASMGGSITIASAAGKGTDIMIRIPMSAIEAEDSSDDQSAGSGR